MQYHDLEAMRRIHPAWRLLRADNAALVIGFLQMTFLDRNLRTIPQHELVTRLDDYLFMLRESGLGDDAFPQSATAYLDTWASDDNAWLRKFYQAGSDEPQFDVMPAAERAISWIASLEQRRFVGTESRLLTVIALLRQIVEGTEADPEIRIAELEKRKAAIDVEIADIRGGRLSLMDAAQVQDRFVQMETTARQLLSDFRQVEANFRDLDRSARERIAGWDSGKGALLSEIFGDRDMIADSDQGKSFRAFWTFLMSPARQEELTALLHDAFTLEAVQRLSPDRRLLRVHYDWLEAGEVAQRTVARLSEQLRRLLDDRVLLENRRIVQIIRRIEQEAIALRSEPPHEAAFMELDDPAPEFTLVMDRPLHTVPAKAQLDDRLVQNGDAIVSADALFDQFYVDRGRLLARIRATLAHRDQASLADIVGSYPLEHGLAELVTYLALASDHPATVIDDARTETIAWCDAQGIDRQAHVPLVIFAK